MGDIDLSQSFNLCADIQGGICYAKYPQISAIDKKDESGIITAPAFAKFGLEIGGGIRWNRYELALHHLSSNTDFESRSSNPNLNIKTFPGRVPVRLLLLTFGYLMD